MTQSANVFCKCPASHTALAVELRLNLVTTASLPLCSKPLDHDFVAADMSVLSSGGSTKLAPFATAAN